MKRPADVIVEELNAGESGAGISHFWSGKAKAVVLDVRNSAGEQFLVKMSPTEAMALVAEIAVKAAEVQRKADR